MMKKIILTTCIALCIGGVSYGQKAPKAGTTKSSKTSPKVIPSAPSAKSTIDLEKKAAEKQKLVDAMEAGKPKDATQKVINPSPVAKTKREN